MAKGKKPSSEKKQNVHTWKRKEQLDVSDEDDGSAPDMEAQNNDDNFDGDMLDKYNGQYQDPKAVFAFDSASDESDDEKLLEERLRQFERVHFKEAAASDAEDDQEEDNNEDAEMVDFVDRPVKNKYGGNVDERFLEIVEDDGGEEPSAAVLEEHEAKIIQKRLASMVSENDVNLDLLGIPLNNKTKEDDESEEHDVAIEAVGANATPQQMVSLIDKRCPELEPLINRVKDELNNLTTKWVPLTQLLDNTNNAQLREKIGRAAYMFVRARHLIGFTYCVNALFYLRLRARHALVDGHPVTARLVSNHKLLEELNTAEHFFMKPGKRLDFLLKEHKRGAQLAELIKSAEKQFGGKQLGSEALSSRRPVPHVEEGEGEMQEEEDEIVEGVEKRKLPDNTKKAGGAPSSKTKRNPRVANRNKFTKAIKRRKAAGVREWQPPVNAYGGELTGIRAGLRRSTKLKM